jgi:hypothetical protein
MHKKILGSPMSRYRFGLFVAAIAATALLASCGGGTTTTPTAGATSGAGAADTPTSAPEAVAPTATTAPSTGTTAPTPAPPAADIGEIEVRVTDAPPEGVTKVLVTVSRIEVHQADAAEEQGWITVIDGEKTFDLVAVIGIEEVLDTKEFAIGKYTQVRMDVVSVVVTLEGVDTDATVPSDRLRIVGSFDVEGGVTTVLTLDFDAGQSVIVTGQGRVQFKPTVKLLVRKEDTGNRPPEAARTPGAGAGAQATPSPDAPSRQPTARPTPPQVVGADGHRDGPSSAYGDSDKSTASTSDGHRDGCTYGYGGTDRHS